MKQVVTIIAFCLFFQNAFSQITEKYYGTAARSEIVLDSKLTFLKGSISVGYTFSPASSTNTDCLIYLTDSSGNVVWEKEVSTLNTDKYYAVIQTYDSNYVAVGSVNASSFYNGNIAIVTKFNQAGAVIWEKQFNNTGPGEVLYDVIEAPVNHHIVATGSYDFTPGLNSGLIVDLNNTTGATNWIKNYDYTGSNQFQSLAAINNSIYVIGFYQGLSFYDGYLVSVNEANGNLIWSKSYESTSILIPGNNCNWFTKIQSYNNDVYINHYITNDYVNSVSETHSVLRLDTTGSNPLCLEMRKPGNNYSNDSYFYMYNNRLYTVQHSANTSYSPSTGTGIGLLTEADISKMSSLNAVPNPLLYSKKIGNTGDQGIYSLNVAGGKILCSGLSINDPAQIGNVDVFTLKSDTNLISNNNCIMVDTSLVFANPTVAISSFAFTNIGNIVFTNNPIPLTTTTNLFQNLTICYDPLIADTLTANYTSIINNPCDSTIIQFTDLSVAINCSITSWHWIFGDGDTSNIINPTHDYLTAGTYNVLLIVTSNTGKIDTFSTVISVINNSFTVTATATPSTVCEGNATTLTANGATSYVWTGGVFNGVSFVPASTTTYTVTGSNANGCTNTSVVTVTVINNLNINISPSNPVLCLGDSVQLFASGASAYNWTPNINITATTIFNPIVFPTTTTTYFVTGSDASGCTGSANILIQIVSEPHLTLSKSSDVECNIHTIQLSASGASSYTWTPASFLSSPNSAVTYATITQATTFVVVGAVGSCIVTDSISVDVYNNDEAAIYIPNAFSPNGDGNNDCLKVLNSARFTDYYFAIYNRWGQRVFESNNANDCWDGNFKNQKAPAASYYYFLRTETRCGKLFKKGDITLIR